MSKKIGVITSGGDCPGLNAVIRAIAKSATSRGWTTIGFIGGFEGLLDGEFKVLDYKSIDGLLFRGGTILGTSNKGRFAVKTGHGVVGSLDPEVIEGSKKQFKTLGLDALIVLGGDGSLTIADQLNSAGIPVVGVPKTIDNDLNETAMTFGFDSAVDCATDALDRLHTTAESHNRVMILEVMGRYAGWIAAHAGVAGGGDVILIPEIPFSYDAIIQKITDREALGKRFTIIVVAEGAREKGGDFVTSGTEEKNREAKLGGVGHMVAKEVEKRSGKETRCVVLGHLQRGGAPTTSDRLICSIFGAKAVDFVEEKLFGHMVSYFPPEIRAVKISDAVGTLKNITENDAILSTIRSLGISLGE